jgi:hypothetical protein
LASRWRLLVKPSAFRHSAVMMLGADRWVGGTHITAGTAWRWDPTAQLLVEPA